MADLKANMPGIAVPSAELKKWGAKWLTGNNFGKKDGMDFGKLFDTAVANALAEMLGGIKVDEPTSTALLPDVPDCVELGNTRIVGGIRPQNFDVAYRPDGVRFAFDSKTLNDKRSIPKNWQNMINDLATEASTVHTRFPYAVVAFMVIVPEPALNEGQRRGLLRTLERMATRKHVNDETHLAEAISLVVWNPRAGAISRTTPDSSSHLHIGRFSEIVFARYVERYKGLPPHD
jgi:hypothetical protein